MNNINYQKWLDKKTDEISKSGIIPTLLLHSCCAPCSSYVIEYLSPYFSITVYYYNPNISPREEYLHRAEEQKRLIESMPVKNSVRFIEGDYASDEFYKLSRGLENAPEGGERCRQCFELRLRKTAELAAAESFDYFTTTLTISPLKNAQLINETGKALAEKYGVEYLFSDFKKKEGYKRSIELSREYGLYRQNYCGCIFSKKENV
ncbi:MAG: epoxyqueuosine reductase QueH [Clostridia bacterium]|nr:epoxyqueuosine reductase QueH [Clostridia bacterium]